MGKGQNHKTIDTKTLETRLKLNYTNEYKGGRPARNSTGLETRQGLNQITQPQNKIKSNPTWHWLKPDYWVSTQSTRKCTTRSWGELGILLNVQKNYQRVWRPCQLSVKEFRRKRECSKHSSGDMWIMLLHCFYFYIVKFLHCFTV